VTLAPFSPECFPEEGWLHQVLGDALEMFWSCAGRMRAERLLFGSTNPEQLRQSQPRLCWSAAPSTHTDTICNRGKVEKKKIRRQIETYLGFFHLPPPSLPFSIIILFLFNQGQFARGAAPSA